MHNCSGSRSVTGAGADAQQDGVREVVGARVAVAGASGYAGGELLRLLAAHPDLEAGPVTAGANAGEPVTAVHAHLAAYHDVTFGPTDPDVLADADLVFLAL